MDRLLKLIDPVTKIRLAIAEATMTAKALEARHLSGPTASMALAEGLVAAALLSLDAGAADEAVLMRLHVTGPLKGGMMEATGGGGLRGFTHAKVLNDLDGRETIQTEEAWGRAGSVHIITSRPDAALSRATLNVNPPAMRLVLARYFNFSMQVPTAAEIFVKANSGGLVRACGMLAQRMQDSDQEAFVRVLEHFESRAVLRTLAETVEPAAFKELFGLSSLEVRETRPLQFLCRCSQSKTLFVLGTLRVEELDRLVKAGTPQRVICHMCGETYVAKPEDIAEVLVRKQNASPGQ